MSDFGLKADGERFLPQFSGIIELEHYHRYFVARELVCNKDVLDIASGEGFGSHILSNTAKSVKGVDISKEAVNHASTTYIKSNLKFIAGSATDIPLGDDECDVVVSFETIEHLVDQDRMMKEIKRVLRPGGVLIISSPNRLIYSDKANYINPFHLKELYTEEFLNLTSLYFTNVQHYSQRVVTGSIIAASGVNAPLRTYHRTSAEQGLPNQMYDIITASDSLLPQLDHSLFEDIEGPLNPQKMEVLQLAHRQVSDDLIRRTKERDLLATGSNSLVIERSNLNSIEANSKDGQGQNQSMEDRLLAALNKALGDAHKITRDKWWRRTKGLREFSNVLKRLRGKTPKTWPDTFDPEIYIQDAMLPSSTITTARAFSGGNYDSNIPVVEYSGIREDFVAHEQNERLETIPKAIAFYLPQFHPFAENDVWWGKGFTEWTNVGRAKPHFPDHYQPHCPIHLGYYDLRITEVMEEQAALAQAYGISGFAYYFYWFAGKVLMQQPLQQMLANKKVDIPFCMIWANENWTRRWDGQENDVLISQKHSLKDSADLLAYLRPFLEDPRYIKINGKPLFVIYRSDIIPDMKKTLSAWRIQARSFGFSDLYIVCAQTFGQSDPRKFGFDAAMQFPPHGIKSDTVATEIDRLDPAFAGSIYNYDEVATNAVQQKNENYKVLPTSMLSWDNTARKKKLSTVFANFTVGRYAQWLSSNLERVAKDVRLSGDEKIVFVNAWNEWAEGTHLEPDQKHGFGYLAATRAVMVNYTRQAARFINPEFPKTTATAIALIIHVHYEHTWPDLRDAIVRILDRRPDIYITVTSLALAEIVSRDYPSAIVEIVDNRGRDIRPFLNVLGKIKGLDYTAICKIHGKASSYRSDGDLLRRSALNALLTTDSIDRFVQDPGLGLLARDGSLIEHTTKNLTYSGEITQVVADELGLDHWRGKFPAGSMFWFRPEALKLLLRLNLEDFDVERGLVDGTRAHAIERLLCAVCLAEGFEIGTVQTEKNSL
jgi:lipopolysaccharide biosynthesis protein/ubiquinone/menaquinone biosynthesis C-methylase UbiE